MKYSRDHFSHINTNLEKGKYFFTVWAELPQSITKPVIQEKLSPILPYCNWISTFSNDQAKNITHITLRYLGYESETLRKKVLNEMGKFKDAVKGTNSMLELGNFGIWEDWREGKLITARLNWQITNKKALSNLHTRLTELTGYDLYENLELNNYNPHISLGEIDISSTNNLSAVKNYLLGLPELSIKIHDYRVGINLISKDPTKSLVKYIR